MTGAAKNTVVKLLADVGAACAEYQDRQLRHLPCRRVQCDDIWSFCFAKEKTVPAATVTPAMESGVSDHVWSMEEIAALADAN